MNSRIPEFQHHHHFYNNDKNPCGSSAFSVSALGRHVGCVLQSPCSARASCPQPQSTVGHQPGVPAHPAQSLPPLPFVCSPSRHCFMTGLKLPDGRAHGRTGCVHAGEAGPQVPGRQFPRPPVTERRLRHHFKWLLCILLSLQTRKQSLIRILCCHNVENLFLIFLWNSDLYAGRGRAARGGMRPGGGQRGGGERAERRWTLQGRVQE